MNKFDPVRDISGTDLIVDAEGAWPNFHDAEIRRLNFWRGDMRPDENVWVGPVIEIVCELSALEVPFVVVMKFHDCDEIEMSGFNHSNQVLGVSFAFEERGHFADGKTPLPPYIRVRFERAFGVNLGFRCLHAEVCERRPAPSDPYA